MYLSDRGILKAMLRGSIVFGGELDIAQLQPASIDLRLSNEFIFPNSGNRGVTYHDNLTLEPGEFILGCTSEKVAIGYDLVCRVEGKSSLGRNGILIHLTAGFVDTGYCYKEGVPSPGNITLEIHNVSKNPFLLTKGMRICQLSFAQLDSPPLRPYGTSGLKSHYNFQSGVVAPYTGSSE